METAGTGRDLYLQFPFQYSSITYFSDTKYTDIASVHDFLAYFIINSSNYP